MACSCSLCANAARPDRQDRATATHYEILGVERGASRDTIKRAYLDRARTFHPDRQHDASEAGGADAGTRMQAINAAWAVLGDADARASYDDELAAAAAVTADPGASPRAPAGARPRPARAEPPTPSAPTPRPVTVSVATPIRAPRWLVWTPIVVGLLLVLLLGLGLALGGRTSTPTTVVPPAGGFEVGACVALVPDPNGGPDAAPLVASVSCRDEHTGRIVSRPDVSTDCPAGTKTVVVAGDPRSLCLG